MSTLSHDDKTPEQPQGGDKVFLRDISDSGTGINDGIIVSTVNQLGQTIVNDRSAEIKTSYESNADTNAFTDAEQTKLAGVETGATADQTGAEIKAAYEAEANTNAFTDAEQTKLTGIAAGAEVNPDVVPQAEAEAGTATTERIWTAERVAQAIAALGGGGGGGSLTEGNLRAVIAALTAAAPDTADTFGYVDAGSPGQMGQATAQQIVEQGNSDLGIVPQKRIATTVDPVVSDDSASGYAVNDLWTNETTDVSHILVDASVGAAVWKPTTLIKTGTAAPAVAPDFVGQVFLDTTNENIYIGIDTVNAADFLQVNGGGVTEKDIEDIIEGKTPAAPATADEFVFRDVSGTDTLGCATAQQIVEQGNSDLGIVPQNRISTTTDPGVNDDGVGTNGINHLVNDLWTNTTTDTSYICQDITANAAVWAVIDAAGSGDAWGDVVDAVITPDADGTRDLATDATRFATAYVDDVHVTAGILVTEAADHSNTPTAAKGEFWVKNDTPCTPMFTDDAGTDHILNAAGGGSHTESAGAPLATWDTDTGTGDGVAHAVGDTHLDTSTNLVYFCEDATATAAVWYAKSRRHNMQGTVIGVTTSAVTGRRIRLIATVPGTVVKVETTADRFLAADASNYWAWNLGTERVGTSNAYLTSDFDVNNGSSHSQDAVYDLGAISGTYNSVQVGDIFWFSQHFGAGTPASWGGVDILVSITVDTAI